MAVVIADQGLIDVLDDMRADADELMGTLHLYKNNYTPLTTSVAGDFTEADFSGYASWNFNQAGTTWPAAGPDGSNDAETVHADIDFAHDGGGTDNDIYGWYILDGSGNLLFAERYSGAPFTMDTLGATFTVTLTTKLKR